MTRSSAWRLSAAVLVAACSALMVDVRAQEVPVYDYNANYVASYLYELNAYEHQSAVRTDDRIRRMGRRLAFLQPLIDFILPDAVRWRTYRIANALPETEAFFGPLNGGGGAVEDVTGPRPVLTPSQVAGLQPSARRQLSLLDMMDSIMTTAARQNGAIRGKRNIWRTLLSALEQAMANPEGSATFVTSGIAATVASNNQQAMEMGAIIDTIAEQLVADGLAEREAALGAMSMQMALFAKQAQGPTPGVAAALNGFRLP